MIDCPVYAWKFLLKKNIFLFLYSLLQCSTVICDPCERTRSERMYSETASHFIHDETEKRRRFFPFDLTQTEYNKTSLHALFNLSFSSIVGYDERQTEWITSAQYESFRVFYLTAFYTVHRARDKTAIRRRFSHKLSIADVFVERVMPKWT